MGCGCKGAQPVEQGTAVTGVGPTRKINPDVAGAVIAAARAGGQWRLKTGTGSQYDFSTLSEARAAQRVHGGTVDRAR